MGHDHDRMFPHQNASVLDSAERRAWLPPDEVVDCLEIKPGMSVADVGAGTGYFALPMADRVKDGGRVHAVDIQPEMLALLERKLAPGTPMSLLRGSSDATTLPDASQDIVLLANVWHEIDDRAAALAEARRILKAAGRIAIVDWRPDCASPPGPPTEHRLSGADVSESLQCAGWGSIRLRNVGAYAYLVTAVRPA